MPWVRRGHINPPGSWEGGASHEHTRSAPEGTITLCFATAHSRTAAASPTPLSFAPAPPPLAPYP